MNQKKNSRKVFRYTLTSVTGVDTKNNTLINYLQKRWNNKKLRKEEVTKTIEARIMALALLEKYQGDDEALQQNKEKILFAAIESIMGMNVFIMAIKDAIKKDLGIEIGDLLHQTDVYGLESSGEADESNHDTQLSSSSEDDSRIEKAFEESKREMEIMFGG